MPLSGGRITAGVVRVGRTVRRPATASSSFVAELLGDLERQGFTGAPRHRGFDTAGREILSYLPGRVPARFQRWTDPQVAAAGSLLRSFHDATRGSRLAGRHPVVCHHDPGPNNTVFADGIPAAFVDFDTASRSRLIDAALDRQIRNARWWHSHLAGPFPCVADDHEIAGRIRWSEQEPVYTSAHREIFAAALD